MRVWPVVLLAAGAASAARAQGAASRYWRPEERTLVTDLSGVVAISATQSNVYAATRDALAIYDRFSLGLQEVVGTMDGYPGGRVTTMVADPGDAVVWLGGIGGWASFDPLSRRFDGGAMPGSADLVVLDRSAPSSGAYFHTQAGWYFVPELGFAAQPATSVPPPGDRIGSLTGAELLARAPAFELVRLQIQRDARLRTWPISGAVMPPASTDLFVATDGNGIFRVDVNSYALERLPAGLLAAPTASVAVSGGDVCAGTDARFGALRRGVTCFSTDLENFQYYEGNPVSGMPGRILRRLLVTRSAVWAATDQGALRVDRQSGDVRQFTPAAGLPSWDVRALAATSSGVWVGTTGGLAQVPDNGALRASAAITLDAAVLALASRGDTLWIGTSVGPYILPPGASAPLALAPGDPALAAPIVALVLKGDTLLAATTSRLAWRAGAGGGAAAGAWHEGPPPAPAIGDFTALAADRAGFWVAGTAGLAFYQPARNVWRALTMPGDVPQPVSDVAVGRDHVWAATPAGVVRLERRVLAP